MALQIGKLAKRSATTLCGALLILGMVLYLPKPVFHVALAGFGVVGAMEFKAIAQGFDVKLLIVPVVITVIYGIASLYVPQLNIHWLPFLVVALTCLCTLAPPHTVTSALPSLGITLAASAYLGFSLIGLSYIFALGTEGNDHRGRLLVLFCFFVVWMGDSAAYFFGSIFGKHKIAKVISPNKSLEGAIANLAGNAVALWLGQITFFPNLTGITIGALTLVFFVFGLFGDLVESSWKRGSDIKDSGQIFPGHGGVLDRVDSIFLTAPVFYITVVHAGI